tara:strand:- start:40 stop:225 length:186 start_codon:yes stop_codon:yes gene_type:complete
MKSFKKFMEGKYTSNHQVSFIKDPTGGSKAIKFVHPIDTRSVDDKMKRPPFNKIKTKNNND